MIFAPTELKVVTHMNTLNVTWHPSPNHTLVSGYKLSYREVEADESAKTHTIRLRKKARYHLLTGMGELQRPPQNAILWALSDFTSSELYTGSVISFTFEISPFLFDSQLFCLVL